MIILVKKLRAPGIISMMTQSVRRIYYPIWNCFKKVTNIKGRHNTQNQRNTPTIVKGLLIIASISSTFQYRCLVLNIFLLRIENTIIIVHVSVAILSSNLNPSINRSSTSSTVSVLPWTLNEHTRTYDFISK